MKDSYKLKTYIKYAGKDYYNRSVNPALVRASTLLFKTTRELRKTQKKNEKNSQRIRRKLSCFSDSYRIWISFSIYF